MARRAPERGREIGWRGKSGGKGGLLDRPSLGQQAPCEGDAVLGDDLTERAIMGNAEGAR